jgi:hypothetical protein
MVSEYHPSGTGYDVGAISRQAITKDLVVSFTKQIKKGEQQSECWVFQLRSGEVTSSLNRLSLVKQFCYGMSPEHKKMVTSSK